MDQNEIETRLEELRTVLRSESISYSELAELQNLAGHIEPGDVELLEAAGVPEHSAEILTADRVEEIMRDCLFREDELVGGEPPEDMIRGEGILSVFGFHPERLRGHADEITAMLLELPPEFMRSGGGGMSFLNACIDKHGRQWTGLHRTMESLFAMGEGIGKVKCLMPRELWSVLPGGVPYYVVED